MKNPNKLLTMTQLYTLLFFLIVTYIILWPGFSVALNWHNVDQIKKPIVRVNVFEGLPAPEQIYEGEAVEKARNKKLNCTDGGGFLGESYDRFSNINCNEICLGGSEDQFQFKYIDTNHRIVSANRKVLPVGGYCLPKEVALCNLNVSYALTGINSYECRTAFPQLLGGITGNQIIGCAPFNSFIDRKRNVSHVQYVPPNFRIDDIDEKLSNGSFRYVCQIPEDVQYHDMASMGLGSRFQLTANSCSVFDRSGKFDLQTHKCLCPNIKNSASIFKHNQENTSTSQNSFEHPCTSCTSGYGIVDETYPQHGSKYGVSIGVDCVDPLNSSYIQALNSKIPCGLKTLTKIRDQKVNNGCLRGLVLATGSYSPPMLQTLLG